MLPILIQQEVINSENFIQEVNNGERHLVLMALNGFLALFCNYAFCSQNDLLIKNGVAISNKANETGKPITCFEDYKVAITVVPFTQPKWNNNVEIFEDRTDYDYKDFIAKNIKDVFKMNREIVKAPKLSFILEQSNYNKIAIEFIYHNATALSIKKDKFLKEVSFLDKY